MEEICQFVSAANGGAAAVVPSCEEPIRVEGRCQPICGEYPIQSIQPNEWTTHKKVARTDYICVRASTELVWLILCRVGGARENDQCGTSHGGATAGAKHAGGAARKRRASSYGQCMA